jgi:hypothetical protein
VNPKNKNQTTVTEKVIHKMKRIPQSMVAGKGMIPIIKTSKEWRYVALKS